MQTYAVDFQACVSTFEEEEYINDWAAVEAPSAEAAMGYLRKQMAPNCSVYGALELAEKEE